MKRVWSDSGGRWLAALLLLWTGGTGAAEVAGEVEWVNRVALGTPVSGVVSEVPVHVGSRVAAGALLLRLDPRGFRAAVAEAQARVDGLAEARAEAEREQERAQELYDRTLLSDHDLQLAKIAFVQADAQYRAARAALEQRTLELEYSALRAPFDAMVLEQRAQVGQSVVSRLQSEPLVIVAEAKRMQLRILLRGEQVDQLQPGQETTVAIDGREYRGTVVELGLEPVERGGYPVTIHFPVSSETRPRAGQQGRAVLP